MEQNQELVLNRIVKNEMIAFCFNGCNADSMWTTPLPTTITISYNYGYVSYYYYVML